MSALPEHDSPPSAPALGRGDALPGGPLPAGGPAGEPLPCEVPREVVRRVAGACLLLAALGVALAVHVGGLATGEPRALLAAALLAVSSGAFVLTFPWSRYHPDWFLLVAPLAVALIAWGAVLTGGAASPVAGLYYVVVALTGAYRGGWPLAGVVGLAALAPLAADVLATGGATAASAAATFVRLPMLAAVALATHLAIPRGGRAAPRAGRPAAEATTATETASPASPAAGTPSPATAAAAAPHPPAPAAARGAIDAAILSSLSLDGVLDRLLAGAAERLPIERASLALAGGPIIELPGAGRPTEAAGGAPAASAAALELPVAIGGERLGALRLVPRGGLPFDERQRAIARDLAAQAAVAIERARLLDRIFRATQELETLFHILRQGVAIAGRDGRIVRVNRSFVHLLGLEADGVLGRPAAEVLPGGVVPPLSHDQVIDPEERVSREVEDATRGRIFEVTTAPLFDPHLLLIGQVHVVRDVTEERRLEDQLVQSEKLAALGQLVAGVAHELNNPVGVILGHADLLVRSEGLDPEARAWAGTIAGQASRAAVIVQQLLSFGRRSTPAKREVDLNPLLTGLVSLVEADCRVNRDARPVRFALALDPALPRVMADPHQLEQVFLNVLTNARQAIAMSEVGGRIEVSTAGLGRVVRIRIADDGPGMPPAVLRRIFDPFFTTKPEGQGTGLGLSICYGIVEEHGGRIWAESGEGEGTAIFIELPVDAASSAC